jgi:uncharacterized protein YcbK (DUF882 family)
VIVLLLLAAEVGGGDAADAPSKKEAFLAEKAARTDVHSRQAPASTAQRVTTLRNVWTDESLPLVGDSRDERDRFASLVRCHYTNQATEMDPRLLDVVLRAARRFGKTSVEIVSGFRAPKYQLFLRKKGREVARDSEHPRGHAVDFRLPGVPAKRLLGFVRALRLGGVGYYPHSQFVHADVGRVRYWRGN